MTGLSCKGDSGGPLVEFNSKEEYYVQVGIVAGGSCNSSTDPTILSRIEDHNIFNFITKHIYPADGKDILENNDQFVNSQLSSFC